MSTSAAVQSGPSRDAQCYNCGVQGHWAVACPEPTRETPAGLAAWRDSSALKQNAPKGSNWGNRKNKGPIITKYTQPPPPPPPHGGYNQVYPPPPGYPHAQSSYSGVDSVSQPPYHHPPYSSGPPLPPGPSPPPHHNSAYSQPPYPAHAYPVPHYGPPHSTPPPYHIASPSQASHAPPQPSFHPTYGQYEPSPTDPYRFTSPRPSYSGSDRPGIVHSPPLAHSRPPYPSASQRSSASAKGKKKQHKPPLVPTSLPAAVIHSLPPKPPRSVYEPPDLNRDNKNKRKHERHNRNKDHRNKNAHGDKPQAQVQNGHQVDKRQDGLPVSPPQEQKHPGHQGEQNHISQSTNTPEEQGEVREGVDTVLKHANGISETTKTVNDQHSGVKSSIPADVRTLTSPAMPKVHAAGLSLPRKPEFTGLDSESTIEITNPLPKGSDKLGQCRTEEKADISQRLPDSQRASIDSHAKVSKWNVDDGLPNRGSKRPRGSSILTHENAERSADQSSGQRSRSRSRTLERRASSVDSRRSSSASSRSSGLDSLEAELLGRPAKRRTSGDTAARRQPDRSSISKPQRRRPTNSAFSRRW